MLRRREDFCGQKSVIVEVEEPDSLQKRNGLL